MAPITPRRTNAMRFVVSHHHHHHPLSTPLRLSTILVIFHGPSEYELAGIWHRLEYECSATQHELRDDCEGLQYA